MKIETRYNLGDSVIVKSVRQAGKIRAIFIDGEGVTYRVRFLSGTSATIEYLYEDELEPATSPEQPGFAL